MHSSCSADQLSRHWEALLLNEGGHRVWCGFCLTQQLNSSSRTVLFYGSLQGWGLSVWPCHCSCLHAVPAKPRAVFPGHTPHPGSGCERAAVSAAGCCSLHRTPQLLLGHGAAARGGSHGRERTAPLRLGPVASSPSHNAPRLSAAAPPFPPRSHGRAGHAAGRAGAGLRAAAGAGAGGAAGGRPLPGAGRGREERSLPGPVRGAESHRAVRAGEEGPAWGLWRGGVRGPGAGRAGAEGKERKGGQCRSRDPPALWWSQTLFTRKEIVQPGV